MWTVLRFASRLFGRLSWWQRLLLVALTPLVCLNVAVAFFGESLVNPLSPFYLSQKTTALEKYFMHRPSCLLHGHGDLRRDRARSRGRKSTCLLAFCRRSSRWSLEIGRTASRTQEPWARRS